jgi:hypothetical protein
MKLDYDLPIDPEIPITLQLLDVITYQLQGKKEVSPRLLYRVMRWAEKEITERQSKLDAIQKVISNET